MTNKLKYYISELFVGPICIGCSAGALRVVGVREDPENMLVFLKTGILSVVSLAEIDGVGPVDNRPSSD